MPELNKLLELREALVALKGPLGNVPAFRKAIQGVLDDEAAREKLLAELTAPSRPRRRKTSRTTPFRRIGWVPLDTQPMSAIGRRDLHEPRSTDQGGRRQWLR